METLRFLFLLLLAAIIFTGSQAQSIDQIKLSKLIFHSSRCNGFCPKIDLQIDSAKRIFVAREFYKTKSELDNKLSGKFKGVLADSDFNKLLELLVEVKLPTLTFPGSGVVDAVETTIIVYYNGQRKYLKSAEPPAIANNLITFLNSLGASKKLLRTGEDKELEK